MTKQGDNLIQSAGLTNVIAASLEAVARLLLRAEAVASSRIEGLEIGARRLLRAEADRAMDFPSVRERDSTAEAVLGNIEAMQF
ncbi:MAG: hypothetical protein EPO21_06215 [Chloroflexota bacterium]|nr:MAG: hypothetical protein EPO21_06215 [Chloroflexota bacterium]